MEFDPTRAGRRGQPVQVTTNSFEVTCVPKWRYYQFDVVIELVGNRSREITFQRRQEIIDRLQTHVAPNNFTPKALYDGKAIMYASHKLGMANGSMTVCVQMNNNAVAGSKSTEFEVRISLADAEPIEPLCINSLIQYGKPTPRTAMATNLLQLLIRQHPNKKYPHNKRAYFTNADMRPIGGGVELWRGFFQSIRPTLGRILINVDTTMATMYKSGHLIDVALDILGKRNVRDLVLDASDPPYRKLESLLRKVNVKISLPGHADRKRAIRGLISRAGHFQFSKDDEVLTVADHFSQAYNTSLRFPTIFGIVTSPRSAENPVVYPAEVCQVLPGQFFKKRIPDELQVRSILEFATMRPSQRLNLIKRGIDGRSGVKCPTPIMEYVESEAMQNSGMKVSSDPLTIQGRILPPPRISFSNGDIQPNDGAWNVVNQRLNIPGDLKAWAVVSFIAGLPSDIVNRFVKNIEECCRKLGMTVEPPTTVLVDCHGLQSKKRLEEVGRTVFEKLKVGPQLVLVLLPQSAAELRQQVKQWGDVDRGVATQCIREQKIWRGRSYCANDQYCNNVAIKINARVGGRNFVTKNGSLEMLVKRGPFMMVGADVTHPGAGVTNRPSVASLVFSWDPEACRYVALSRVQSPRQELIEDLKDMMKQSLRRYYDLTQRLPVQIFFFRDGVSEGELEHVERYEISAIQEAIKETWKESRATIPLPKITFIVVGKRHHVRFFPEPYNASKSGNCKSGFVADKGISSAFFRDFYLQSHGGLLGTSRPGHYIVLRNDSGGTMDDIQALTFELCHVYAKATRSVSIPAPVYYADLVCSRANLYFDQSLRFADETSSVSSGDSGSQFDLPKWQTGYPQVHGNLRNGMFFL